jgi:flagellar biosynthesis chaperone FliJ
VNRSRLADVLRIRRLQERTARGELAVSNQRHHAAIVAEATIWTSLDQRGEVMARSGSLAAVQATRLTGTLAAEAQHAVTEQAGRIAELAGDRWGEAARRVEALERLGDRLAEAEADERDRAERNELDDLVLARRRSPDAEVVS